MLTIHPVSRPSFHAGHRVGDGVWREEVAVRHAAGVAGASDETRGGEAGSQLPAADGTARAGLPLPVSCAHRSMSQASLASWCARSSLSQSEYSYVHQPCNKQRVLSVHHLVDVDKKRYKIKKRGYSHSFSEPQSCDVSAVSCCIKAISNGNNSCEPVWPSGKALHW